ncbi:MAG: OmpH family outer membrane protein [Cytophagales bacterium]
MKTIISTALLILALNLNAQHKHLKLGYTNVEDIVVLMPESKTIESELKSYKNQLDNSLSQKMKEFEEKYTNYQKGASMMSDVIRADKERELRNLQESIEAFQKDAEMSIQRKQIDLLDPVLKKVQKAIEDIANENGFDYIFNTEGGFGSSILLHMPKQDDVTNLVLKKLNISQNPTNNQNTAPTNQAPKPSSSGALKPSK